MANTTWNFGDLYPGVYNSPEVTRLQKMLVALGYRIAVDGDFGEETDTAVRQFQTMAGLRATGTVDNLTAQAIEASVDQGLTPGASSYGPPESGAPAVPTTKPAGLSPLLIAALAGAAILLFTSGGKRRR
jgi:peptidoglycan hydrolase-like protein with peptidoglycan-binding domain